MAPKAKKGKKLDAGKDFEEPTKRQARLPEMEDAKIEEIHNAAMDYVDARDKRQHLTEREVERKTKLLAVMKKHDRKVYRFKDVSVEIVPEGEKVKVRITDPDSE